MKNTWYWRRGAGTAGARLAAAAVFLMTAACVKPEPPVGLVWDALHAHHPGERVGKTDSMKASGARGSIQVEGQIALVGYCPEAVAEARRESRVVRLHVRVRPADRSLDRSCDDVHTVSGVWYSATIQELPDAAYTLQVRHSVATSGGGAVTSDRDLRPLRVVVR